MSYVIRKTLLLGLNAAVFGWAFMNYSVVSFYHPHAMSERLGFRYFWVFAIALLLNSAWFILDRSAVPEKQSRQTGIHYAIFVAIVAGYLIALKIMVTAPVAPHAVIPSG